jgi:carbamoylphosphate synthase large subunit
MINMDPEIPSARKSLVGVKVPQFSFARIAGADPTTGVDMISTGEVACFGDTKEEAYLKALVATSFKLPKENVLLSIGSFTDKAEFAESARMLHEMGFKLWGSVGTADYYSSAG